jgi:hypothetical protein
MLTATVVFGVFLLLFAVAGDCAWVVILPPGKKPFLLAGWLGATAGALVVFLGLNCVFMFPFVIDPRYALVNEVLMAGIVGAVIDLPLSLYRNLRAKRPWPRTATEAVIVIVAAGMLLIALDWYRTAYPPHQLPI